VVILSSGASFAQDVPEDLEHKPVDASLLTAFMDKYGHKNYKRLEGENKKVIRFKVSDEKGEEVIEFSIMFLPERQILKFECNGLADVPSSPEKRNLLLQRLTELNGMRTTGKYCFDKENNKVRYFYYRTVVGGICYADFKKTLRMIEYIVFSDLKAVRDFTS